MDSKVSKKTDVLIEKRNDFITDLLIETRQPVFNAINQIWKEVYTSKDIPQRFWLERFQLSLKKTVVIPNEYYLEQLNKAKLKVLIHALYHAYKLTGELYLQEEPLITETEELLISFLRELTIRVAREIWHTPYIFYHMTHKKEEVPNATKAFDKLFAACLKYTLRQQTNEMIVTQRAYVEKHSNTMKKSKSVSSSSVSSYSSSEKTESINDDNESYTDDDVDMQSIKSKDLPKQVMENDIKQSNTHSSDLKYGTNISEKYEMGDSMNLLPISRSSSLRALVRNDDNDSTDLFIPRKSIDQGKLDIGDVDITSINKMKNPEEKKSLTAIPSRSSSFSSFSSLSSNAASSVDLPKQNKLKKEITDTKSIKSFRGDSIDEVKSKKQIYDTKYKKQQNQLVLGYYKGNSKLAKHLAKKVNKKYT